MKLKNLYFFAGTLAALSGFTACSDFDYGFEAAKIKYEKNFEKAFGSIDPNGTWNATRAGAVQVSVDETSQVMVYAKGLSTNLQLRSDVVFAGDKKTITYDVPAGVKEVYVIAKNKNDWQAETVAVGDNAMVSFGKNKTRAAVNETAPSVYGYGMAHLIRYANYCYTFDKSENIVTEKNKGVENWYSHEGYNYDFKLVNDINYPYPTWGAMYSAYPWPATSNNKDNDRDRNNLVLAAEVEVPKTPSTLSSAILDAVNNVIGSADNQLDVLEKYTHDINSMVTVEPGEIELTFVHKQTNSGNTIGYYYTFGDKTTEELKGVKKYVLIPTINKCEQGDKFKLVYFGENYDEEGRYEFPAGCMIHFFLSRSSSGNASSFNMPEVNENVAFPKDEEKSAEVGYDVYSPVKKTFNDVYGHDFEWIYFSDAALNETVKSKFAGFSTFDYSSTAVFSVMGMNCISFEDYPAAGSIDWNDAVFTIDAPFNDFESFDEVQSFVIAIEDLGDSYDFDYNDAVIRVSQTTTTLKYSDNSTSTEVQPATVTLLAAGGTMPIKVGYDKNENGEIDADEVIFQEIHGAFNCKVTTPVNVDKVSKTPVKWVNNSGLLPDNLSLASDAPKFLFFVENTRDGGDNAYSVGVPTATKGESTVPLAFIIPDAQNWQWPGEGENITSLYGNFSTWVADNDAAEATYWYNYNWGKSYSGGGSGSESGEGGSGESTPAQKTTTITDGYQGGSYTFSADCFPSSCTKATITFTHDDSTNGFYTAINQNGAWSCDVQSSEANAEVAHELTAVELAAAKKGALSLTDYGYSTLQHASKIVVTTE